MGSIAAIIEGRTICSICDTDKAWITTIDRGGLSEELVDIEIEKYIQRQNTEVVDVKHEGHVSRLVKTTRVIKK